MNFEHIDVTQLDKYRAEKHKAALKEIKNAQTQRQERNPHKSHQEIIVTGTIFLRHT
ncbi:hypothetical protein [Bibersteinia trehalosi]|uniref:hypothetical protein n=1 Tax=Bibersteinia trehalosi TaxID=47735 RepID=UPI0012DC5D61|nr:hypothetical protein [Bibersteinia trehalosi]